MIRTSRDHEPLSRQSDQRHDVISIEPQTLRTFHPNHPQSIAAAPSLLRIPLESPASKNRVQDFFLTHNRVFATQYNVSEEEMAAIRSLPQLVKTFLTPTRARAQSVK
ncbi:hypothetical protein ACFE04_010139 [Oxalis oulophora]